MTQTKKLVWTFTTLAILLALPVGAQPRAGRGEPQYDLTTETQLAGSVVEVKEVDGPRNRKGIHLIVEAGEARREVCVGPIFYLDAEKISFAVGDAIEVVGSEVQKEDDKAVMAREIKRGQDTITLRDARGIARWSRGNR